MPEHFPLPIADTGLHTVVRFMKPPNYDCSAWRDLREGRPDFNPAIFESKNTHKRLKLSSGRIGFLLEISIPGTAAMGNCSIQHLPAYLAFAQRAIHCRVLRQLAQ